MSSVREEPQHTNTCNQPCRPDCTRQVAGQGGAMHNTQTPVTNPGGQTALGSSPVREEPQNTNTCDQPCQPDHTWQVTGQGGATTHIHVANPAGQTALGRSPVRDEPCTTHKHLRPTLPARPHSAGRRSGRSHNTYICSQPCRPDRTQSVYIVQAHLSGCNLYPKHYKMPQVYPEIMEWSEKKRMVREYKELLDKETSCQQ